MPISPQLILAPTIHRARQLETAFNNPLSISLTISRFIKTLYERHGTKRLIDQHEAKIIIGSQLASVKRKHFDYLTSQSEALDDICALFIAMKRNRVMLDELSYEKVKEQELQTLFEKYENFLEKHRLCDQGDVEVEMLGLLKRDVNATKAFGDIYVDDFDSNGIHFESSKLESEILESLLENGAASTPVRESTQQTPHFYQPLPVVFDQVDEVAAALKIARRLLDEGSAAEDIIIVSTSIDEYAPIFESQLQLYGLKGYSSKGTLLKHYLPQIKEKVLKDELLVQARKRYEQLKATAAQTRARFKRMGLEVSLDALLDASVEQTYIKSKSLEGILLTEANQILSLHAVKHLIFMGTDMSHLPPQARESFLVTQRERQTLFHGNSIYLSSQNHYLHMKDIAENIYIVTASYKGKTKLARSLLITETCEDFDISKYETQHELLRSHRRVENGTIEPYLDALQSNENTAYDGLDVGSVDVKALSASQLNSYATCPRRYFMDRILGLKAPQENEEGFDVMQKGTILHRCFELFAIKVKERELTLGASVTTTLQEAMQQIAITAYEEFLAGDETNEPIKANINHRLFLQELQKGLDNSSDLQGPLQNFLEYVIENRSELDHFRSSEFEMEFRLDEALKPIDDESRYFIKGYIDRIDILKDEIRIVDYKSKKMDTKIDKKKIEQMKALKDMQLALYILFARRRYGDKKVESHLQTFKSKYGHAEFAKAATYEVAKEGEYIHYDDDYEQELITKIAEIRSAIEAGDFLYDDSDEDQCKWCEFALMCKR